MGLFHRAIENSRQPERGQKTRRDLSLKSRLDLNLDVGSRPRFGARFGAEEIKVALDGTAGAELDVKGLKAGILCQNSYAVLAVLRSEERRVGKEGSSRVTEKREQTKCRQHACR